jgi:hypothetical protein
VVPLDQIVRADTDKIRCNIVNVVMHRISLKFYSRRQNLDLGPDSASGVKEQLLLSIESKAHSFEQRLLPISKFDQVIEI